MPRILDPHSQRGDCLTVSAKVANASHIRDWSLPDDGREGYVRRECLRRCQELDPEHVPGRCLIRQLVERNMTTGLSASEYDPVGTEAEVGLLVFA